GSFNAAPLRLGIVMRTRKPGKRYGESPSTRNRLSGAFIEALAEQWREHGDEILDGLRKENRASSLRSLPSSLPYLSRRLTIPSISRTPRACRTLAKSY